MNSERSRRRFLGAAGVETVPAGVGELTKLQARDGFAYIETP